MKLTCFYLRRIVLRVGPELSMRFDHGHYEKQSLKSLDKLIDTETFLAFAPDIFRFGLALELSESEIASPIDGDLEDVEIRPWGIFRWPAKKDFAIDSALEKFTQSIEKMQGGAFRIMESLHNVRELALSCNGGLGYLQGPDINPLQPPGPGPIFGGSNVARDTPITDLGVEFDKPYRVEMLERKLAAQGVDPSEMSDMILSLILREGGNAKTWARDERQPTYLPKNRYPGRDVAREFRLNDKIRLQPDQLTETQKRYLHKHLSAQQAVIQSFQMTIIGRSHVFQNLAKLNIARIPSFFIHLLCHDHFWDAMPQLSEVALGVVPDWRELEQFDKYTVVARQVYPTQAIPKVVHLLRNYIGKRPRITHLHFEWLCGGELAPGYAQRGCFVLPAPFLLEHRQVINSSRSNILVLPHITHLSLKNCWFAPNIFYRIMYLMSKEHVLESLELETVSLSGPPIMRQLMDDTDILPGDEADNNNNPAAQNAGPPAHYPLRLPLYLSWSSVIDMLTPNVTIKQLAFLEKMGGIAPPMVIKKELKLKRLSFKSCGYVTIHDKRFISERRFLQLPHRMRPNHLPPVAQLVGDMLADGGLRMPRHQGPGSGQQFQQPNLDRHLARIYNHMDPWEMANMNEVFGFTNTWHGVYDEAMIAAARRDGVVSPGLGRFSGVIEYEPDSDIYAGGGGGGANAEPSDPVDYNNHADFFDRHYDDSTHLNTIMCTLERIAGYDTPMGGGALGEA